MEHLTSLPVFSYKNKYGQITFLRFDRIRKVVFAEKNQRSDSWHRASVWLSNDQTDNEKVEFFGQAALKFMEYYKMVFPVMDLGQNEENH